MVMEDWKLFMKDKSPSLCNQALSLVSRDSRIPHCFSQPHLETESQTNPFPATKKKKKRHQTLLAFPYMMKHNTPSKSQTLLDVYWPFVTGAKCYPCCPNPLGLPYLLTEYFATLLGKKWKWIRCELVVLSSLMENEWCKTQAEKKAMSV